MKRTLLAIGAAAVMAVAAIPTSASAQHWRSGHFRGPGISFGFGVTPGPYYGYGDYGYSDYGYADCSRFRRVRTPYGWETRRVWVC